MGAEGHGGEDGEDVWDAEGASVLEERTLRGTKGGVRVEKEHEYRIYRLVL